MEDSTQCSAFARNHLHFGRIWFRRHQRDFASHAMARPRSIFLSCFDCASRFANAAPGVIDLTIAKYDNHIGTNNVAPVDRNALIPEVITCTPSEALPVAANSCDSPVYRCAGSRGGRANVMPALRGPTPSKGRLIRCTVPGSTPNRFAILRTPSVRPGVLRAARIRASSSAAIRGRPRRLPSCLALRSPARTIVRYSPMTLTTTRLSRCPSNSA
jgi:hypothetical protein